MTFPIETDSDRDIVSSTGLGTRVGDEQLAFHLSENAVENVVIRQGIS